MLEALKRFLSTAAEPTARDPLEAVVESGGKALALLKQSISRSNNVVSVGGVKVTPIEAVFGGLLAGMNLDEVKNFESYLRAGSKKIWATWRACDLIGGVILDTQWKLQKRGGDGTPVEHPQLTALLLNPNPFETWGEFAYRWLFHMKLTGNAFWVKDQANLKGDKPLMMFAMNPKRVRLVVDPNRGVIGYIYEHPSGRQIPFDAEEVIHFKRPHPDKEFWGLGDIEAGEPLFQENLNRTAWASKFWKNGASPSGILICEDSNMFTDKTKFEEAKKKWQKEYGGTDNSGKTAWLTGKWKYEQLGLSSVEMQNLENEKWNVEAIFMQHGIPLSVAGVRDAANFATARQDDLRFRRYCVKPMLRWLSDKLQKDLIAGFDPRLQIVFQISGLTDVNQIATDYTPLFDRGVVSINEMRALLELPPKKDDPLFDQHFLLSTLVPVELAGVQPPTPETGVEIVKRYVAAEFARRES